MIAYKGRETKRGKTIKMPKNLERLYKEGKCRDCSVVVTRMDFAKILGKFTKVKIQYESSSTSKSQKITETATPNSNARLKNNENGMVLLHRSAYNQHPAKELTNSVSKKAKTYETSTPTHRQVSNILKENNSPNKGDIIKDTLPNRNLKQVNKQRGANINKQYAIIFSDPLSINNNNDYKSDYTLTELLPNVDKTILPSEEWCIDCFPKVNEPTDDKVYDRIAAELEDLMYNEKPENKLTKTESFENKVDDFPSIMDILNDNTPVNNSELKDQSSNIEFKDNLESTDVEAMLLGSQTSNKVNDDKIIEPSPMEVDSNDVNKLIEDVVQFNSNNEVDKIPIDITNEMENPHSPSILDEALQKGIEEHLPCDPMLKEVTNAPEVSGNGNTNENITSENTCDKSVSIENPLNEHAPSENPLSEIADTENAIPIDEQVVIGERNVEKISIENSRSVLNIHPTAKFEDVTHVIFKKILNGTCIKSVTCPKNLKYCIELDGKSVEFLGAPKYISSLEDLQVLLQIVNETDLKSLYVVLV